MSYDIGLLLRKYQQTDNWGLKLSLYVQVEHFIFLMLCIILYMNFKALY